MKREEIEKLLKDGGMPEDKVKETVDSIVAENGNDIAAEVAKTAPRKVR